MNVTVFIKQIPDTNDVKWTENNNIDRIQTDSIMNPVDKTAIEAALRIKETKSSKVTIVSMGPKKAEAVLKEAIAMGADEAILLCDSKFAGSDTLATSKILAASIKEILPDTNILIFGKSASDGETGQTGPCVAARLNIPFISDITDILEITDKDITVNSETDNEKNIIKSSYPVVLCINNYVYRPRLPKITGYINAQDYTYKTYNTEDLKLTNDETGIKGSPTYVSQIYKSEDTRNGKVFDYKTTDFTQIYEKIMKKITTSHVK